MAPNASIKKNLGGVEREEISVVRDKSEKRKIEIILKIKREGTQRLPYLALLPLQQKHLPSGHQLTPEEKVIGSF